MLYVFNSWVNPALFHTGWFVESLFTQTLIIHVIRTNKIPFIQSRASKPLLFASLAIVAVGGHGYLTRRWLAFGSDAAATTLLGPAVRYAGVLCVADSGCEKLVLPPVWGIEFLPTRFTCE